LQEGNRVVPKWGTQGKAKVPQQGVTELKTLIKWLMPPRNLARAGGLKRFIAGRDGRSRTLEVAARV
jgi:hypothetical protein